MFQFCVYEIIFTLAFLMRLKKKNKNKVDFSFNPHMFMVDDIF